MEALKDLQLTEVVDMDHEMGRGAYGQVKEVSVHGTVCAAKVIHEILLTQASEDEYTRIQKMFIQECIHCSKLRHPNLVQFVGVYYPEGNSTLPWLIMEKLYASLTVLLNKYQQSDLSFARKMSILQDVALGVQYLHSQGIVHRDLSSNNILLTKHLVAKLSDFGVAKMIDPQLAKSHTQVPGTLIFMPPESLSVKPQYGQPVDVFSFGCVTIHILTHKWPIPDDQVTRDMQALSEIERRKKYLREVKIISPLMLLIAGCLKNAPDKRPTISEVVQKLQSIVTEQSLFTYDNIIELKKHFQSEKTDRVASPVNEATVGDCHTSKCVKLSLKVTMKEKSIQVSESFSKVMENLKLPGSVFTEGSHFIFCRGDKMFVLCDMKKYYNIIGRFVVMLDLQNGTIDYIDKQVRRYCPFGVALLALERDNKFPSKSFYRFDPSSCEWVNFLIPDLPQSNISYPDMLVYSSQLLVISGSLLQVYEFNQKEWYTFKLLVPDDVIEASCSTSYAILDNKLFICYARENKLYRLDLDEINDAIVVQSQPAKTMTLCLTRTLYPVNYIFMHEKYLVALYVPQGGTTNSIDRAWYYSTCCDHWHNITSFDPYIDGQWFTMENGKAAVAELSASWYTYVFYSAWTITVKMYEVKLSEE